MARVVMVPGAENRIDTTPLLAHLADDVVDVMKQIVPVDEGDLRSTLRVGELTGDKVRIHAGGMNGAVTGKPVDYPHYVERGTSKMSAQPYMRPALYRYRSGNGVRLTVR